MKSKFKDFYTDLLLEMSLPTGFNKFDVISLDKFLDIEEEYGQEIEMNIETPTKTESVINDYVEEEFEAEISDVDINKLKKQRMTGPSKGLAIAERPEKMLHQKNIVDENGKVINNKKLKAKITKRPDKIIDQNTKLKKSGSTSGQVFYDSTLPSYMGLFVDEDTGDFKVVKTCPSAGECSKFCYAAKGGYVMFPSSSLSSARVVNFLMNDPEGFKKQMTSEIKKAVARHGKKNTNVVLRWHDSGDFLSEKYLQLAFDVAKATPEVLHYAYTKQVPLVKQLEAEKPENFVFNFSFGGKHDDKIDVEKDKHAQVVPANLFKDLPKTKTSTEVNYPRESITELKQRVAKAYNIDVNSLLTYDELLTVKPKDNVLWNVLVWKGHGDDAATRRDVLGTYLLFH